MNKIECVKQKISQTKQQHQRLSFPIFISQMRRDLSIPRSVMSSDLNIPYLKLFNLETGNFAGSISEKIIAKIAKYFDISEEILQNKLDRYLCKGDD